jgi:RNA polymerase sigma factor (sigma-70 family)
VQVNTQPGIVKVEVTEGSDDSPTADLYVTKFPDGWGEVSFWLNPPIIPVGGSTTLNWSGPAGATYAIEYYTPQTNVVSVPTSGQAPLSNLGQYPASGQQPLELESATTFYLTVTDTIGAKHYSAQQQRTVTVDTPPPDASIAIFSSSFLQCKLKAVCSARVNPSVMRPPQVTPSAFSLRSRPSSCSATFDPTIYAPPHPSTAVGKGRGGTGAMTLEQDERISEVVEREQSRLHNFIRRRVPDPRDAEDILQDVFSRLVEANRLLMPIDHVTGWLFRVARNRIIDLFRQKKPESFSDITVADEEGELLRLEDLLPAPDAGPDALYARNALLEELELAVDELPDEQRRVFVAHELEGRSFKEIAAETGVSVNTLLSRKRYAVLHLRRRLQDIYDEFTKA